MSWSKYYRSNKMVVRRRIKKKEKPEKEKVEEKSRSTYRRGQRFKPYIRKLVPGSQADKEWKEKWKEINWEGFEFFVKQQVMLNPTRMDLIRSIKEKFGCSQTSARTRLDNYVRYGVNGYEYIKKRPVKGSHYRHKPMLHVVKRMVKA